MKRLILDVSTVLRWVGPPVGIVRVEHELAQHARRHRPDVLLSFYDPVAGQLRQLAPRWADVLLSLDGIIDLTWSEARRHRPFWRNLLSFRHPLIMALELARLRGDGQLSQLAATVQRALLGRHAREFPYAAVDGTRHAVIPWHAALGPVLRPGCGDTVLSAGSDWLHKGTALFDLKRELGFRSALMCYDIIPLTRPEMFQTVELAPFEDYWRRAVAEADLILCNATCVADDLRGFAERQGQHCAPITKVPLGYAAPVAGVIGALPAPLRPGRFALFVSTLEPRKGHRMLLQAWQRLLAAGVPQQHDFDLVFVGRRGWDVDDLLGILDDASLRPPRLVYLEGISDATLQQLYADAAFCLYPSSYEGFGLPIIEAMAHGRALIASTGGAVPETVAGLGPCLDPQDVAGWTAMLGAWIADPAERQEWERRIRAGFRYRSWPDAAEGIMQAAVAAGCSAPATA